MKGTLSFQPSTMEQDSEFNHIDSVIASLNPAFKPSVDSQKNEMPESLPVPLLADFGHFEGQNDEYILVESDNDNKDEDVGENYKEDSKPCEVLLCTSPLGLNSDSGHLKNSKDAIKTEEKHEESTVTHKIFPADDDV